MGEEEVEATHEVYYDVKETRSELFFEPTEIFERTTCYC